MIMGQATITLPATPVSWPPPSTISIHGGEYLMTEGKLEQMFRQQYEMQRDVYGIDYATLTDEERIHHFKEMLHAMNDEMHEALGEMGWKPWASSKHFNQD